MTLEQTLIYIAQGMGNLPLNDHGPAGVGGINDGRQRAIYLQNYVGAARAALDSAKIEWRTEAHKIKA